MANEYKTFYLKDLEALIDNTALSVMKPAFFTMHCNNEWLSFEEVGKHNNMTAMFNQGVRELRASLLHKLETDGETEGDDDDA